MLSKIHELVEQLSNKLIQHQLTITTAESCTGGGLSYYLTSLSGSSTWFDRGFVTYSDQSKIDMLNVHPETIANFGAVSEETAREMAEGALHNSHAHISLSITGIAGPTGGSAQKPVGTVWTAWSSQKVGTQAQLNVFPGDRETVRLLTIQEALIILLRLAST